MKLAMRHYNTAPIIDVNISVVQFYRVFKIPLMMTAYEYKFSADPTQEKACPHQDANLSKTQWNIYVLIEIKSVGFAILLVVQDVMNARFVESHLKSLVYKSIVEPQWVKLQTIFEKIFRGHFELFDQNHQARMMIR
jgi:hypothetical protein